MDLSRWRRRASKLVAHPRPVRLVTSRVLWHSGLSRLLTTPIGHGLRMRFYPSSISAALWVEQDARNEDAEFLELVLRRGDRYVDAGANVGHLSLVARACVGDTGDVVAIEANPRIFSYCVGNMRLNKLSDVRVLNLALGETTGEITIGDQRADDQNNVGTGDTVVPMKPLDDLVEPPVTLLKIDVEGYEVAVLRGAKRTLAATQVIYCELSASNSARFGFDPGEAERLIQAAGFVLLKRSGKTWERADGGVFSTLSPEDQPRTGYNLVAVRSTYLDTFANRLAERGHQLKR